MKKKIKNLALITFGGDGMPVANRFKESIGEEGKVIVGMIKNAKDIYLPSEIKKMEEEGEDPEKIEKEEDKKVRFKLYEGILDVYAADSVVEFLKGVENKEEWFVFFDMNTCFKYGEIIQEFMPYGNFPTAEQRELEVDREKAKKFIEDNYPDVKKEQHWEFKTAEEGIKFVEQSDEILVLKGNNGEAPTVVPPVDDLETAKELLIEALETNKDKYNAGGLIFEVKLEDAIELTPERIYFEGEELFTDLDIETKKKYAGDVGGQLVGCGTDCIIMTNMDDKINQVAFPEIVDEMAKKAKSMFIWDLSVLISKRTGKVYPGEFCPNRCGWNAFLTEMEGIDPVQYFTDVVNFRNPLEGKKFSSSTRIFNDEDEKGDIKIIYPEEAKDHVWIFDGKMKDGELVTVGYDNAEDLGVITGHGDTFAESVKNLYDMCARFALATKRWGYRSKGDYLDTSYGTSIVNRYNYAVDKGLITGYEAYTPEGDDSRVKALKAEHEKRISDMTKEHEGDLKSLKAEIQSILNENA